MILYSNFFPVPSLGTLTFFRFFSKKKNSFPFNISIDFSIDLHSTMNYISFIWIKAMSHIYMITQLEMQYLIIHILMIILLVQPTLITKAQLTKKICTEQNFRDTLISKLWSLLRFFRGIFFKSKGNSQVNFMKHFLSWKKLGMRIKELFGSKILVWPCSTILRLFQKLPCPVRQKY